MRLKPEKIEQLAELVYDHLAEVDEAKLQGARRDVVFVIRQTIEEDLQAEEAIEAEARRILEEHEDDMRRMGVSWEQMLRKTKQKLARDRGMVL
jgi:hypothetical protein